MEKLQAWEFDANLTPDPFPGKEGEPASFFLFPFGRWWCGFCPCATPLTRQASRTRGNDREKAEAGKRAGIPQRLNFGMTQQT